MDIDVYRQKPLRVHSFLAGVPLRMLGRVELPGGREGITIEEISGVVGFGGEVEMEVGPATQALFRLRTLTGTSLWVWANAAAWAVGMPVVFVGAGLSPVGASALSVALTVVVTIAAAGASVGAIHGFALLWLLRQRQEEANPAIEHA